jgi:hypothetical protein
MANLDKLLRKLEQNKENAEKTTTHKLSVAGEAFDVRTMTRAEKRDFIYSQEAGKTSLVAGDLIKKMKKTIYNCLNLKGLAVKAKEEELIDSFYDVIELLFEPEEIIEIVGFIFEINKLSQNDINKDIEEIKK